MDTPRINLAASVTRELARQGAFSAEPLVLADVGVSGGIPAYWRQFEPHLAAFGFDTLVRECERLNRAETNPRVRYFDRFVGWDGYRELFPEGIERDAAAGWSNQPFPRTSAARLQHAQEVPFAQHYNANDPELVYTSRRTSLDAFFGEHPAVGVDFIKVDTDGQDYEVLLGARRLLDEHKVLGLLVEMQFHGVSHPHANLFANIDRLLREHGFSLFDLETYRYSRANLPGRFVYRLPAQTREGQVLAGDALYLRDVAAPGYEERWGPVLESKLLKLVCLFEIFGMPDCAAELLELKRDRFEKKANIPELLDLLAAQMHPAIASYAEINRRFAECPERFYPPPPRMARIRRALPEPIRRLLRRARSRLFAR
jgi:hypothetical protein